MMTEPLSADGLIKSTAATPSTLAELLSLPFHLLATCDIARVNLLCAEDLPNAGSPDIPLCLEKLDNWTNAVRRYTHDTAHQFRNAPQEYQNHVGVFQFIAMMTLLKHPRGLGISYQPTAIGNFRFSDSRDDFIHGLLTRLLGTCASLPVLFVSIGRWLGYPMHLALAKHHFLCQWVDEDGHKNLEGSCSGGGDSFDDEHYHTHPYPLSARELSTGRYLRPLTPVEELACFLELRGHCLRDNGRLVEAKEAYIHAHELAPHMCVQHERRMQSLLGQPRMPIASAQFFTE